MKKANGNYGIRFKTTPREGGGWLSSSNGRYIVLTEQTILDLQEIVKAGHSAQEIVELLSDSVYKASLQEG